MLALVAGAVLGRLHPLSQRVGAPWAQLDGLAIALCVGTLVVIPVGHRRRAARRCCVRRVLAGGAAVAILSSILPYSLELIALRRLRAATFGLLMSLEPAVAALAGVLVLGQPLHVVTAVAIVMVVIASVGTTLTSRAPAEPASEIPVAPG